MIHSDLSQGSKTEDGSERDTQERDHRILLKSDFLYRPLFLCLTHTSVGPLITSRFFKDLEILQKNMVRVA